MINLETNEIILGEEKEMIDFWEVWWHTPKGLMQNIAMARALCKDNDWPMDVIRPVPVAISSTLYEVG